MSPHLMTRYLRNGAYGLDIYIMIFLIGGVILNEQNKYGFNNIELKKREKHDAS